MKKTINTNIAGIIFNIEEDAYEKLDTYLKEIKIHFGPYPDHLEIIADIESRIAEQFLQNAGPSKIVNILHVEELIRIMGQPVDFDKEVPEGAASSPSGSFSKKRLFRNKDGAIIAGVASGIATYFGIDVIIVRLIFVVIVLAGGSGILFYIIFWIIVPAAKTAADKLEMRGEPISIDFLREKIRNYKDKTPAEIKREAEGLTGRTRRGFVKVFSGIFRAFGWFIQIIFKIVGSSLIAASCLGLLGLTIIFLNLVFNLNSASYVDPAFSQIASASHPLYYGALITAYVAVFVVLVFLWIIGLVCIKWRAVVRTRSVVGLFLLFAATLITASVLFFRFGPQFIDQIKALPSYQFSNIPKPLSGFSKIEVDGSPNVHLVQAKTFSVIESGRKMDLDNSDLFVRGDTLVIGRSHRTRICIVCFDQIINVEVSAPNIDSIGVFGSGTVNSEQLAANSLNLDVAGFGTINAAVKVKSTVTAQIRGSGNIGINGAANNLKVSIAGSGYYGGFGLISKTADVSLFGSGTAEVNATNILSAHVVGSGSIAYKGSPALTKGVQGSGSVESAGQ